MIMNYFKFLSYLFICRLIGTMTTCVILIYFSSSQYIYIYGHINLENNEIAIEMINRSILVGNFI